MSASLPIILAAIWTWERTDLSVISVVHFPLWLIRKSGQRSLQHSTCPLSTEELMPSLFTVQP